MIDFIKIHFWYNFQKFWLTQPQIINIFPFFPLLNQFTTCNDQFFSAADIQNKEISLHGVQEVHHLLENKDLSVVCARQSAAQTGSYKTKCRFYQIEVNLRFN